MFFPDNKESNFVTAKFWKQTLYSREKVAADSISAVYRGPKKNLEKLRNKRFVIFKTRPKLELAVTWRNAAAQTRPVLDSSPFVPPYPRFPADLPPFCF
jgi:hypothetical protein